MVIEPNSESAVPNEELTINFTVTNHGSQPSGSVLLEFSLGEQTSLLSILPAAECLLTACNFRSLGANESLKSQLVLLPELGFNTEINVRAEVSGVEPDLNGTNNEASITLSWLPTDEQSRLLWSFDLSNPSYLEVSSDAIYLSSGHDVYALNKANGEVLWRYRAEGRPTRPVGDGETVYFGSSDGRVYAVDASTGVLRWSYKAGERWTSRLVVAGGSVYLNADGSTYSLDALSGGLNWRNRIRKFVIQETDLVVADGSVYIQDLSDLLSLDALSGNLNWSFRGVDSYQPATVTGGSVYHSYKDSIFSLDSSSGTLNWKYESGSTGNVLPVVSSGNVYFGSYSGDFYSLDPSTGTLNWRYESGREGGVIPIVFGDSVYYIGNNGSGYSLDASTGHLNWQYQSNYQFGGRTAMPRISDGSVYFWSGSSLHSLDASMGMLLWQFNAGDEGSFAVDGGILYGVTAGKVFALHASP